MLKRRWAPSHPQKRKESGGLALPLVIIAALIGIVAWSRDEDPSHTTGLISRQADYDVFYRNCDQARAAGAAPINFGEPGYRPPLDADSDGVACEPYFRN